MREETVLPILKPRTTPSSSFRYWIFAKNVYLFASAFWLTDPISSHVSPAFSGMSVIRRDAPHKERRRSSRWERSSAPLSFEISILRGRDSLTVS